ncbi:EAL domain-containing protein [Shewanella sp. ULN5]|uniref:EAL domain-containing protein n=1 Tax=Shewanella sp. ULN5 TaxID=2994678 RepID=UPI00273EE001|nr:EAL domain-containing protein [Shewanella sp. ULN5]MDP5145941.1 EAL domain-containing protein [Shewanella sp. ULN5]
MPKILSLLLLIFTFFQASFTYAMSFSDFNEEQLDIILNYESYTVANGLSQNTVTSIVEDSEGYVWIGTVNGLNRFDGTEFTHFYAEDNSSGLPSSFIRNLIIDDQDRLLVGTDKGLAIFDNYTETFSLAKSNHPISNSVIWALHNENGINYVGLNNEIYIFNENFTHEIKHILNEKLKEIKKIRTLNDDIYLRNFNGEIYLISNKVELKSEESTDFEVFNKKILISKKSGLFYADEKILDYQTSSIAFNKHQNSILIFSLNEIISIQFSEKKYTIKKVGKVDIELAKNSSTISYLTNNSLFLSDYTNGVQHVSINGNLASKVDLNIENIWSISQDENFIAIANNDRNIFTLNEGLMNNGKVNGRLPVNEGHKTVLAMGNDIFIGSSSGLIKRSLFDKTLSREISPKYTVKLKKISNNTFLAGTFDGEVLLYNIDDESITTIDSETNHPVFDLEYVDGDIYIATQKGLLVYSNKKIIKLYEKELVASLVNHKNKVYFGSRTAIMAYDKVDKKIVELLKTNKITYSLDVIDDIIIAPSNMEVNLLDIKNKKQFKLTTENGTLSDYSTQSTFKTKSGIVIGGPYGLTYVAPKAVLRSLNNNIQQSLSIKNISIFNEKVSIGSKVLEQAIKYKKSITLKHSDYPFTFDFNIIGSNTNKFEFYYKLEGIDVDWLPNKNFNSATYTNLPHGTYIFSVYAIERTTGAKSIIKNIEVVISPPWWLSTRAKIIYSFITLVFFLLITKAILRRREIQKQIALSEERLKLSLWGSGDEMWDWDIESGKIFRSNIWGTLDFPQDGRRSGKIGEESNIHPIDQPRVQKALNDHFSNITDHFEIAYRVKGRNNQWMWILDRAKIVERDQKDHPVRMTGTIKDINNIKQVEEQLKLFARAIENISEGMFILNQDYVFVEVNEACCEIASCSRDNFMQQKLAFTRYPESYSEQIRTALRQQGRWSGEIEAKKGDNNFFLMELTIDTIYNEQGETSHYVGVFSDITRRKQQEEELRKLTNNDLLTGLPNRSSLQVTLNNLVKKDIHHTLMVLDLDNFKRINDSLGHQIGDELLISVAERIKKTIPSHASLYRLGGDEFALLIDQNPDIGSSAMIASNIIQSLKPAFELNEESLVLGISIGVVLYPEDEQNEQALLRKADIAMYHAKSAGGNRYQFYSESLNQNALRQLEIENLIREALKEDYFEVYYQPKVDLKSDCLAGMEALVRLNHPKHGIISPNDFIPLAEENGLIVEIGDVVLRKACFAANKWLEQGLFNGRVAVNLSSRQFALTDLQQRIESILRLTKLPAKHLELEITEGTVIKNPEKAIKVMQQLAKMGVSLALDDFGTGYSSLSYLKRFPINCLKIDKSFVDDIDKSDRDLKMVDSIITIAHNMGLTVVAEGVEQNAQLNILKALNCEEIQGYIFSKPVPEKYFEQLLATDQDKRTQFKTQKPNKN